MGVTRRGLTLSELLVCLAIIGVIGGCVLMLAKGTRSAGEVQVSKGTRGALRMLDQLDELEVRGL